MAADYDYYADGQPKTVTYGDAARLTKIGRVAQILRIWVDDCVRLRGWFDCSALRTDRIDNPRPKALGHPSKTDN